jgi:hypothetical protein
MFVVVGMILFLALLTVFLSMVDLNPIADRNSCMGLELKLGL